jgi:phosphotriesterase-related protein
MTGRHDRTGRVQTVLGLVDPSVLGRVMTHEHLLIDLRGILAPPPPHLGEDWARRPVTPEIRFDLVHHPQTNLDDLVLDDETDAIDELHRFRAAGGGTIVDATTTGIGRDPLALRRISVATGVHITMGTGWYVHECHPPEVESWTEDQLADLMVREIEAGVGDTGIRAGHIGEIGCETPTDRELKVLRAAVQAQARTGAMLLIHQGWKPGDRVTQHRLLDIVEAGGGSLGQTVLAHMDRTGADPGLQISLLERGVTIEYDLFGYEVSRAGAWDREVPSDIRRIHDVRRLIEAGFRDQLVAAQDICFKTMLTRHGGSGYAHLLRRVVPGFHALGLSGDDVQAILETNPMRLLTFTQPAG